MLNERGREIEGEKKKILNHFIIHFYCTMIFLFFFVFTETGRNEWRVFLLPVCCGSLKEKSKKDASYGAFSSYRKICKFSVSLEKGISLGVVKINIIKEDLFSFFLFALFLFFCENMAPVRKISWQSL